MCVLSRVQFFMTPRAVTPPGSSVHGILQARILQWLFPPPGDLPHSQGLNPCLLHWQAGHLPLYYLGSPQLRTEMLKTRSNRTVSMLGIAAEKFDECLGIS